MSQRLCPSCSYNNEFGARYCTHCATFLLIVSQPPSSPLNSQSLSPAPNYKSQSSGLTPTERKMKNIFLTVSLVIVSFSLGYIGIWKLKQNTSKNPPTEIVASASQPDPSAAILPSYKLIKNDDYEDPGTAKVIREILIQSDITKESLTNLMNHLYAEALTHKFKTHTEPLVIDIKAYMSIEHHQSGIQWVAWINNTGNNNAPNLKLDDNQINNSGKKSENKMGLSEEQRKEIFKEYVHAEDRANIEAEEKYPAQSTATFQKQEKYADQLKEKYKNQIAKKYNLTRKQLEEISREGQSKSWAFPD